jgi:hopanoid biosynthesis associated RND transporter like protein HpnN
VISNYVNQCLSTLVQFSISKKYLVVITALVSSVLSIWLTIQHAQIDTNTENMLSDQLDWRIAHNDYKSKFPFFSDTIVVVVEGPSAELAFEASSYFVKEIIKFGVKSQYIFFPESEDFFRQHKFLYLDSEQLVDVADTLTQSQAMLGMLAEDPSILGLLDLTNLILNENISQNMTTSRSLLDSLTNSLDSFLSGANTPMSWQNLLDSEDDNSKAHRILFTIQPDLKFNELLPGSKLIEYIRGISDSISNEKWPDVNVRLTGPAALGYDELDSVVEGAGQAGILALIAILLVLSAGLKSPAAIFSIIFVVILGLTYTSAFAAIAIGSLNMISIAFSVLYVGLAADFAIHFYYTYIEESSKDAQVKAVEKAAEHNIAPLSLCAFTTSIGFLAFIPTAYKGVAELGLIAGVGMIVGLLSSFTILPAVISIFPGVPLYQEQRNIRKKNNPRLDGSKKLFLIGVTLISLGGLHIAKQATFDVNPINLNNPDAESVTTLLELSSDGEVTMDIINFIVPDKQKAQNLVAALIKLPEVKEVKTMQDFIPDDQNEKLKIIENMMWSLGGDIEINSPANDSSMLEDNIDRNLETIAEISNPTFQVLAFSETLNRLKQANIHLDDEGKKKFYRQLDSHVMRYFPALIAQINSGIEAEKISLQSLPKTLKERWVSNDGSYRLEIIPENGLGTSEEMGQFIKKVREVVGQNATGVPIINAEASQAVIKSFIQAFLFAIVIVTSVVWLSTRSIRQLLIVMTPLVVGCVCTVATLVALNMSFNFANIIALPLLIGISVDSTLHVLYRYKRMQQKNENFLQTGTAKAVFLSALTTGASFGNLAFSPHAGTASMGVLLSIGLVVNLICSLILLPLLLNYFMEARITKS